jgi:hypothetical protein
MDGLLAHTGSELCTREALALIKAPEATDTHKPIPHISLVEAVLETLAFRHINVVREEFAVSKDGMKLFGVLDLEMQFDGCRFSLGLRNANDRSMRLGLVVGFRILVCDNLAFSGDYQPVLAKHSKHFDLHDSLAIGVDKMQRNFEPMRRQVEAWKEKQITDEYARLLIYKAFIEDELEAPKHLGRIIHKNYFAPEIPDFAPRTSFSLHNAFTSAFKQLDPIPLFRATASFGEFFPQGS